MRRPPPLPSTSSERQSTAAPTRSSRSESRPPADAASNEDATATAALDDVVFTGRLAPVVPFEPPTGRGPEEGGTESMTDPAEGGRGPAEGTRLGVRDVWAAARARRRALRREVRRFTVRQRRRRYAWLAAAGAVALVAVGAVGVAYSPLFAVDRITVVGTERLDPAVVEQALSGELGTPLALVDSSDVKAALVNFPMVETYSIEARPPQELVVRIVERTPVGSVPTRAGFTLVDAAGVALATSKEAADGFPVIDAEGGAGSRTFRAVGAVYRTLPEGLRAEVAKMSATTPNDVTLTIEGADVLWGGADEPAEKARVLAAAMKAQPPAEVDLYDVSSPDAVVIR